MIARRLIRSVQIAVSASLLAAAAPAADWPQWRGPNRNGITSEHSGWDGTSWNIQKKWQTSVGSGMGTSPIIVNGRVYVMGNASGKDTVWCLDVATGGLIWKQQYTCPFDPRYRFGESPEGPASTPTFDPETGYLYTLSIDGDLNCWNTANGGSNVWHLNFYNTYSIDQRCSTSGTVPTRDYGYCGTPLLLGNRVVIEVGDESQGNIMAFDKLTGTRAWTSEDKHDAGHNCGPVLVNVGGTPCIASFTLEGLRVMRADAGHEGTNVAWFPWVMPYNVNCPTPAVSGNTIVLTSTAEYGSGKTTTFLQVGLAGITNQWQGLRQSYVCSPVIHAGHVYTVEAKLYCMDFATGTNRWEGGASLAYWSNGSLLVTGDNKVIAWGNNTLLLVETAVNSPGAYTERGRIAGAIASAAPECHPHVALGNGWILVKDKAGRIAGYAVGPVDADGDSLPDGWELEYFGSTTNVNGAASADGDGDGHTNLEECLAGTNPTNAASVFRVTDFLRSASDDLMLRWQSVSGRYYSVYICTNLFDPPWSTAVYRRLSTATGPMSHTNADGTAPTFFRLGVHNP